MRRAAQLKAAHSPPKPLLPTSWFELLIPETLRDEQVRRRKSVYRTAGRLGRYNIAMLAFDFSVATLPLSNAEADAVVDGFEAGGRRSGLVIIAAAGGEPVRHCLGAAMTLPPVVRARERLAASRRPLVVILGDPVVDGAAQTVGSIADVILAEAPPATPDRKSQAALDAGLIDQVVQRGRLPGVLCCLFDAMNVAEQRVG